MDIDEINDHIHKLKCGSTDWQSVEKLAALCTVRNELEEKQAPAEMQTQALPPASYVEAASAAPFGGLMEVLNEHMSAIKLAYPKEYELVMRKITAL